MLYNSHVDNHYDDYDASAPTDQTLISIDKKCPNCDSVDAI